VLEVCIFSNGEVGMFSFVGLCRPYIPCNSQDDFHHTGQIGHHSLFLFGGVNSPAHLPNLGLRCIVFGVPYLWQFAHWAISLLCSGGSIFIVRCYIYSALICPRYSGRATVLQKAWEFSISVLTSWGLME
jgi:hypothetical protein